MTFKSTFIEVGQRELDKNRQDYVYSVGVLVTGLMALAGVLYLVSDVAAIVALVCALVALWGRYVIKRQVMRDFAEMHSARETVERRHVANADQYREFVRLRGEQMLRDNKALTPLAKSEINDLLAWARG